MSDPTINWCPPTTNCYPYGSASDQWIVDYRHGNSPVFYPIKMPGLGRVGNHMAGAIPTVDPFCPAPWPEAVHGVQSLPPACFGAAPMAQPPAGIPTAMPPCGLGGLPPTFNFICTVAAPQAVTTNPVTSAGICFPAAAPHAQASPDTILTLPPLCFGAAAAGHTDAVNGVQSLPPACFGAAGASTFGFSDCGPTLGGPCHHPTQSGPACAAFHAGIPPTQSTTGCPAQQVQASPVQTLPPHCFGAAAPHAFDQQPSIAGFFGCPVSIGASCQSPSTVPGVFGCPVIPSAAGGPCVFSVGCHDNHVMALGVTTLPPHCFGAAPVHAGIPPTQITSGCPAPQVQASPTFAALIDCGPTLGGPCHHPTQSGPACGSALAAQQGTIPTMFAGCHAPPSTPLSGCQPTINPACPPVTQAQVCPNPTQPVQLCSLLNPGCQGGGIAPAAEAAASPRTGFGGCGDTLPPRCAWPAAPEAAAPPTQSFECPYPTKPSLCLPPTMALGCPGAHAAVAPPYTIPCPPATVLPPCQPPSLNTCPQTTLCPPPTVEPPCQPFTDPGGCPVTSPGGGCVPTNALQCPHGHQAAAHAQALPPTWLACTLDAAVSPDTGSYHPLTYHLICGYSPPFHPICMPGLGGPTHHPSPLPTQGVNCVITTRSSANCSPGQAGYYAAPTPRPTMLEGCPPTMSYRCSSPPSVFPC